MNNYNYKKTLATLGLSLILISISYHFGKLDLTLFSGIVLTSFQIVDWIDGFVYKKANSIIALESAYKEKEIKQIEKDKQQDEILQQIKNDSQKVALMVESLSKYRELSNASEKQEREIMLIQKELTDLRKFENDFIAWIKSEFNKEWRH